MLTRLGGVGSLHLSPLLLLTPEVRCHMIGTATALGVPPVGKLTPPVEHARRACGGRSPRSPILEIVEGRESLPRRARTVIKREV